MAKSRKDNKGRALRKGETFRKYDSMYVYKYTDPLGKKAYIYSKDLNVLREKEDQLRKDQLDGLDTYVKGKATINFVFDRYIESRNDLRSSTYANYVYTFDHYIRDGFGKKKIADIKYSDVLYFYQYLLEKKDISIGGLSIVHTVLHPTFQFAVRDSIIRNNPADGVFGEVKKKSDKTLGVRHALTVEQQKAFINFLERPEYYRYKPILTVLLGTGCRIGEVIGLRWEDIDMENRMININHAVTFHIRKGETYSCKHEVSLPKTSAGFRTIPMLEEVYEAFKLEKELQEAAGCKCNAKINGMSGFVFCNRFGNIRNPSILNHTIKCMVEKHNAIETAEAEEQGREPVIIPRISCHHLRHTFCTRFCENETNVKVIQSVMGHADITTTMNIYAEVTDAAKKEAFKNLSRNLSVF